jgi:hypothetical protein
MSKNSSRAPEAETEHEAAKPGRDERFLARLDTHIAMLATDAARAAFIEGQLEAWQRRYARFIATQGASEPVTDAADPPQAADFLLTIAALAARRKAIGPHHQPKTMESAVMTEHHPRFPTPGPQQDRRLAGALLSLLVAADRRCPAIIGQAHLLYHVSPGTQPQTPEKTFAQLKRDADDLIRAIDDVDAAMKPPQPEIAIR